MRAWLVVLLGCQRGDPPPPPVPEPILTTLVGCAPAAERPRVTLRARGADLGDDEPLPTIPSGWFPYAVLGESPAEVAGPAAAEARAAVAKLINELDVCLVGKVGSVSLMLEVAKTGAVTARAGGIGHRPTEQCLERAVKAIKLAPRERAVELECGLSIGAAGPLRVTADGYRVVEVKRDGVMVDKVPHELKSPPAHVLETYLVIADVDVGADQLARVLDWTSGAPAVLVAVRADGGPPVFLAMGPDLRTMHPDPARMGVGVVEQELHACAGEHRDRASLLEPKRVDAMLDKIGAACGESCSEIVEVGIGGAHAAKQLVGATSAVRRAGRDPVLAIGTRCAN